MIDSEPAFIQGVIPFVGGGYNNPVPVASGRYTVPANKRAQTLYFRGGNSAAEMIAVVLMRDGRPMRYFPIGAKASEHVQLALVEDLEPETKLDLMILAPEGVGGIVVVDLGFVEI